jgi:hypothetical protein
MRRHKTQLLVCHERIGSAGPRFERNGWCDLTADVWCFTHDMFVCSIHVQSHHRGCDTEPRRVGE